MIGFLIIFGTCIASYAQTGPWVIAVATLGLLALSYAERGHLITRAVNLSLSSYPEQSLVGSLFNALCATGAAYAFGFLLRVL